MESGLYQPKMKERLAWVMLFVLHGTIKSPCAFLFYFLFFLEVHSLAFFLANFCGYWLWDLQAPVARVCACGSVRRRQECDSTCKWQDCREFFLLWSQRSDGSGPWGCFWRLGLSPITSPAVTVVWPSRTSAALLQQSPIGVKHSWQRKMS